MSFIDLKIVTHNKMLKIFNKEFEVNMIIRNDFEFQTNKSYYLI